jgi:hypothetical protein
MHRGLPWSCSGLTASTCAGSYSSSGSGSMGSNAKKSQEEMTTYNVMHGVQSVR